MLWFQLFKDVNCRFAAYILMQNGVFPFGFGSIEAN